MTRLVRTATALIAVGILTAGCGSRGDQSAWTNSPASPSSGGTVVEGSGTNGEPGEGGMGPAPLRPGDPPNCRADALRAAFAVTGGGMGKRFGTIQITNRSTAPCSLSGPVNLALAEASGRPVPSRVQHRARGERITVPPGASAWLVLSWTVIPGEGESGMPCQPAAASVAITVPDAGGPVTTTFTAGPVCNQGAMSVAAPTLTRPTA
ncbi:DUF4232 domain-containing protein [Plantactinospora sp. GCM10030261]|uniref:DUF4232 domain-containing protein n=1 Tax=Plantactinospora sp. GCM10030261 TaxID=3273420 RepID=UPI003610AECA